MVVLVIIGLWIILGWYKRFLPAWKSDFLSLLLFGLGLVLLSVPVVLSHYLSISEYRLWIIQGPAPFSQMGGGPYMMWKCLLFLASGFGLVVAALRLKLKSREEKNEGR